MIHPNTAVQFISDDMGHGVVATRLLPAGTITWALDKFDRVFHPDEVQALEPVYRSVLETYCFRNKMGHWVFCWDHGRYVNHSFNPNCLSTAYGFEIAIRDILPGEQLTNDYGNLNIIEPFSGIDEGTRRKTVYPDDLLRYHAEWDTQIQEVFHRIVGVEQPLKEVLSAATWEKVENIVQGKDALESVRNNYYDSSVIRN